MFPCTNPSFQSYISLIQASGGAVSTGTGKHISILSCVVKRMPSSWHIIQSYISLIQA